MDNLRFKEGSVQHCVFRTYAGLIRHSHGASEVHMNRPVVAD